MLAKLPIDNGILWVLKNTLTLVKFLNQPEKVGLFRYFFINFLNLFVLILYFLDICVSVVPHFYNISIVQYLFVLTFYSINQEFQTKIKCF